VAGRAKWLRGVKKEIRGIFAIGFSGQNGRSAGVETRRLPYPWKGGARRPQDRRRGDGASLLVRRPREQECP